MSNVIKANNVNWNNNLTNEICIKVKKLSDSAIMPIRGSQFSAGMDLHANISAPIVITPHETVKIGTGLAFELPHGYFGGIFARSGLATKQGLRPGNCVGVADEDYIGEYIVALHNDTDEPQTIHPSERIAQLVIMPYLPVRCVEVDELTETERGDGGFGHSGRF